MEETEREQLNTRETSFDYISNAPLSLSPIFDLRSLSRSLPFVGALVASGERHELGGGSPDLCLASAASSPSGVGASRRREQSGENSRTAESCAF